MHRRPSSLLLAVASAIAVAASTSHAGAQAADPPPTPTPTKAESKLEWSESWPRFRPAEIAFTGGMALNVGMALFLYPAPKNNWDSAILFDKAIRDTFTLQSRDARNLAASVSDGIYYALAAYPMLDTLIVAGAIHREGDLMVQMLAINLESYAFGGAIALSAEKAGRRRPMGRTCEQDPSYDKKCGNDDNLNSSFLSGHTTIGFVGAGLLCAHHLNVPLYGGGAPDTATCIAGMSAAVVGGALRVASDNHWASDVLLGAGVGLFAGYGLPVLLHYGRSRTGKRTSFLPTFSIPKAGAHGVVAPTVGPNEGGLSLTGTF